MTTLSHLKPLVLAALVAGVFSAVGQSDKRPNIVFIMADDLGYGSLGCYGCPEVKTPNIDRLAASGVRLTDFHSNGAMCSPTRAALLTGRYPQRCAWVPDEELSPVFREQRKGNPAQRWAWGISTHELTLPGLLRQAGYRTALIGKWHLGYDINFHPMNYGFDEFRGYVGGNVDYHTHVAGYGKKELDWWKDRKIGNEEGYTTDLLAKHAVDFIARNKEKPFFLYLAHGAPHDPWQGRDSTRIKPPAETYREMIEVLDESVGAVIQALRENHLETNTIVVFSSDNGPAAPRGFAANGRLQGKKGSMLEGGHRVPLIASWPGVIPAGTSNAQTVMTMDFLPTFTTLAGVTLPQGHQIDGTDIMPLLKDNSKQVDRVLHWLFGDAWAVRKGAWKLIGKRDKALTLVNLEKDLGEKNNLINERPQLADELLKLHRDWIAEVGDK
jgi:arylsulfatase A-like enzyme